MKENKIFDLKQNIFVGELKYDDKHKQVHIESTDPKILVTIKQALLHESELAGRKLEERDTIVSDDSSSCVISIDEDILDRTSEKFPVYQLLLVQNRKTST